VTTPRAAKADAIAVWLMPECFSAEATHLLMGFTSTTGGLGVLGMNPL
jgi:hypothetical protein